MKMQLDLAVWKCRTILFYSFFSLKLNSMFYFEFCNCNSATARHRGESVPGSKMFFFFGLTELLHIPPGSKDADVFSPGGVKGSAAAPGEP